MNGPSYRPNKRPRNPSPADSPHSFAKGLRQDLAAVTAGLTLAWNSGASRDT